MTLPTLVLMLVVAAAVLGGMLYVSSRRRVSFASATGSIAQSRAKAFPARGPHEVPDAPPFATCPAGGDGGDAELNRLKNRVDSATFVELSFDSLLRLRWPPHVEGRRRAGWTARDRAAVATREGAPVAVVGYLAGAKASGPESTNCHGADARMRDYHLWVTAAAREPRARSVVVEMTPRLRAVHPSWRLRRLGRLVRDSARVRVSGWLMLDPEHPDQIGKTRGTIWEIHPVMNFEVERGGRWLPLDSVRR